MTYHMHRPAVVFVSLFAATALACRIAEAQVSGTCRTDRIVSTIVGAGLGAAAGAIPATIVHRHDQRSSHRIVIGSVTAGALIGFVASGRDRSCSRGDSSHLGETVVGKRSAHAKRGALIGGGVGGAVAAGILGSLIGWAWPMRR